jgi:hypothetical protein
MSVPASSPQFESGSFRDPDTRVFHHDGAVFRCLTPPALADWTSLAATDFYARFTEQGRLIPTTLVDARTHLPDLEVRWTAVLEHERVPMISYPYEWTFSMLRDAALLQLDLTLAALDEEMTLKDATPFNIQWIGSRPTFIDHGSFTAYRPGQPWAGYRQFCEQFLYPLLLQAYRRVPFQPWLRGSLEGITAAECWSLLGLRDCLRPGVLSDVYLHAKAQARFQASERNVKHDLQAAGFGSQLIKNNIRRLRRTVERLRWDPARSTWSQYEHEHGYEADDLQLKLAFVRRVLAQRRWSTVWDFGCNTGVYSRLASEHADSVLALDADQLAVDRLYRALARDGSTTILPLVIDLANPSSGLGWRGTERMALVDRGAPELALCLALIHHLVISRHIPLADLIAWLAGLGGDLVLEFVTPEDPMVERLLRHHDGRSLDYSTEAVEAALARCFASVTREHLPCGTRTLYYARAA